MLEAALRHLGFDVQSAATGREALAAAVADPPDVIVLDVMLPDLDGFEVCRRLRTEGSRTPVLFLTARDGTEDKVRGLTLGGDDYLVKPFSLEELVGAGAGRAAPVGPRAAGRPAALRRPRDGRRRAPGAAGRRRGAAVADRVQPAALPADQPGSGPVEAADPRPRVAVRLRWRRRRRRDLHRLPAPQGRQRRARASSTRSEASATPCERTDRPMSLRARLLVGMGSWASSSSSPPLPSPAAPSRTSSSGSTRSSPPLAPPCKAAASTTDPAPAASARAADLNSLYVGVIERRRPCTTLLTPAFDDSERAGARGRRSTRRWTTTAIRRSSRSPSGPTRRRTPATGSWRSRARPRRTPRSSPRSRSPMSTRRSAG